MTIVAPQDLVDYMSGIRLPAAATAALPGILDGLQGDIEAFLRYPIEPNQTAITETVGITAAGYFATSVWPIASVTTITDSTGAAFTNYTFDASGDLSAIGQGPWDPSGYTITYVPGLPARPMAIAKSRILRAAAREVANMHDDSRIPSGDPNGRKSADQPIGFQKGELKALSRWKRRAEGVYSRPQPYLPGVGPSYDAYGGYAPGAIEVSGVMSATSPGMFEGDATTEFGP